MTTISNDPFVAISGTLGQISAKVERLVSMDERLRKVETTLTKLEAQAKPKAPWWAVVGAVVGILTGLATLIGLVLLFSTLMELLSGRV